jgi:putative ABC transport system permease protein
MPNWKRYLRRHFSSLELDGPQEARLITELADHLEDLYQDALSREMSPQDAEAAVVRWLGDTNVAASELIRSEPAHARTRLNRWIEEREERLRRRGSGWKPLVNLVRDLRLTLRGLAKRPVFTAVVVLVLALGIGATAAIFTMLDRVVLSPLPFHDADRLISIGHSGEGVGIQNAGQCAAWHFTYEDENRVFEDLGMYGTGSSTIIDDRGEPEAVPDLGMTSGVLRALRIQPVLGRLLTPEDEQLGSPNVILLSEGYWRNRFGGDSGIVGRTVQVDGASQEIVGVLPASLRSLGSDPAIIYPYQFDRSTLFVGNIGFGSVARLKDGVSLEQAHADVARMIPLALEKFPGGPVADFNARAQYAPIIRPLSDTLVGSLANLLWILMAGVAVVLLIACANVANLFLVRADGRETEMAIRTAMGASRRRIGWEYLKESLVLGLLGGVGGLAVAYVGLRVLVASAPTGLPRFEEVSLNVDVLLFALVVSLAAGAFFGVFPVLKLRHGALVDALKQGGRSGTTGKSRHRVQNGLAVSQIALALVLLVGSGLMLRSFLTLKNVDPGFHGAEDVLTLGIYIPRNEVAEPTDVAAAHERIALRLAEVPGVTAVGLATAGPMYGFNNVNPLYVEGMEYTGDQPPPIRRHKWIGEDFLETLGVPLLVGRSFTWQDVHDRIPAVLVSERLAREYWGSPEAALGHRVAARPDPPRWYEIVGVVADVREDGLAADPPLLVYWPQVTLAFWEGNPADQVQTWRGMSYAIRSSRVGTPGLLDDVRQAIWEVNPHLPLLRPNSLESRVANSIARTSFTMILLGVAAGVALLLGVVGVYGVISYAVSQRTRELGMRMALGARDTDVTRMVLRQGLALAAAGLAIGLALAYGVTRLMAGLLFGISPQDPTTFALVPAGLLAVALLASYLPARRAAQVDPMVALRAE